MSSGRIRLVVSRGDGDWERVARFVTARRGAMGLSQTALAREAGMDIKTLNAIERRPGPRRAATLGGLERALGWREGSIMDIADGGDPTPVEQLVAQPPREDPGIAMIRYSPDFSQTEKEALIAILRAIRERRDGSSRP